MKSFLMLLSLAALCSAVVPIPRVIDGRIVNGEEVKPGEASYQVSLQTPGNIHFCSGAIINENHVITAASCVESKRPNEIRVIGGTVDLDDPVETRHVSDIIIHERYDEYRSWINDIAILKLSAPFEVSETISYARLPEANEKLPTGYFVGICGWGLLRKDGDSPPKKLRGTGLFVSNKWFCNNAYESLGYTISPTQFCARGYEGESGSTCHGDSGGPMIVYDKLFGIVSWVEGCDSVKYPTVLTKVTEYVDWINEKAFRALRLRNVFT